MRKLHEFIKAHIEKLNRFKSVELYNSQDLANLDKIEERIFYPAVFIEYSNEENNRLAYGALDRVLTVRFRFLLENYTVNRLDDLDLLDEFTQHMTSLRGSESDLVQFTSFEELGRDYDENHDMVNLPIIDFRTVYRDINGYKAKQIINVTLDINPEIDG